MLNVTITSKSPRDAFCESIVWGAFETLSNLAFLYNELEQKTITFEEGVRITRRDITVEMQQENSDAWKMCQCPAEMFRHAMQWAKDTVITFTIDTVNGKRSQTVALFPCKFFEGETLEVAWTEEPDFIMLSDDNGEMGFVFFNQLLDFVMNDVDDAVLETVTYEVDTNG